MFKNRGDYGVVGQLYAWIAFGVVLYTFRVEASYFRYTSNDEEVAPMPNAKVFTLITAIAFSIVVLLFSDQSFGWLDIEVWTPGEICRRDRRPRCHLRIAFLHGCT
ncbi:MAG: hypothetical protein IPF93_15215 [Saprospiraceae bacterium]|nr:hypothetical protein [Saprospiraceae bacterium]